MITDTGNRKAFESGAVRDMGNPSEKGSPSLIPLEVLADWLHDSTFYEISILKKHLEEGNTAEAIVQIHSIQDSFRKFAYINRTDFVIDLSKHFLEGMKKYSKDNWKLGIPYESYLDSAIRHYIKWMDGLKDESHDRAFLWNLICLDWSIRNGLYTMDKDK